MSNKIPIKVVQDNCRGCRRCEVACAWHAPGPLNPRLAGIQIMKLDEGSTDYPVLNLECLENFCGKVHSGAKGRDVPACVGACLFGALELEWEEGHDGQ